MKKILYLYAELMGYQIPILKEYVTKHNSEVCVLHDIKGKLSKYKIPLVEGVTFIDKDEFSKKELVKFVLNYNPDIVYVSGWMYYVYLVAIFHLRKRKIPVVTMFDDIWWNTIKQRIASVLFPLIKNRFYSHAWVAGPLQFEYAKKLGFKNNQIIFNALSCDIDLFNDSFKKNILSKKKKYPHNFLYVGRFSKVKGVDILINAWNIIQNEKKDWKLTIIGNGPLKYEIEKNLNIEIIDFLQPENLVSKLNLFGCIIIPSRKEQWSITMQEFAAGGFPIICSDVCGAAPLFVIPNYNGFIFRAPDEVNLANQMLKIINTPNKILIEMSENSHKLGQIINPEISSNCFISILNK